MTDMIGIATDAMSVEFSLLGAEMRVLRDEAGRDLLSDGDPRYWTGRAPFLFPVVGALNGEQIHVDGRPYPMAKHGVARKRMFSLVEHQPDCATLRLEDDGDTRSHYPFAFRLDIHYAIQGTTLLTRATIHNPADTPLPASFGFHPAFRWPLPWGGERADHRILFDQPEPAPIRRIVPETGLVLPEARPTPVEGDRLAPRDDLFVDDALIFEQLNSRRLRFGVPGGRMLDIAFPDLPLLGIWTKPGAPFLCIEPWQGLADPIDYQEDFRHKPHMIAIPPGGTKCLNLLIDIGN